MSTTHSTAKDSTDTYVRSSDTDKDKTGKNKDTDKTTTSTTATTYGDDSTSSHRTGTTGTSGSTNTTQYGQQRGGQQSGQDNDTYSSFQQYGKSGTGQQQSSQHGQQDVQHKLKEVGHLLQRAGQLLQDLQVTAGGDYSSFSSGYSSRGGQGGNYSGPYGGFESQSQQYGQQYGQQSGRSNQFGDQYSGRYGQQQQYGRGFDQDRDFTSSSYRGASSYGRDQDHEQRLGGRDVDRYGGFGGPNRPDLAYGGQFGGRHEQTYVRESDRDRSGRW